MHRGTVEVDPSVDSDDTADDNQVWLGVLLGRSQILIINFDELIYTVGVDDAELRKLIQENFASQICIQEHFTIGVVAVLGDSEFFLASDLVNFTLTFYFGLFKR